MTAEIVQWVWQAEQASRYGEPAWVVLQDFSSAGFLGTILFEGDRGKYKHIFTTGSAETVSGELTDIMIRTMLANTPANTHASRLGNLRIDPT